MPRGKLGPYREESAQLLTQSTTPPDRLGQTTTTWVANAAVLVGVQPLGSEEQTRMGLSADRERLRVQLPRGQALNVGGRVRLRGRDWKAVRVEQWQSYTLAVCEGV